MADVEERMEGLTLSNSVSKKIHLNKKIHMINKNEYKIILIVNVFRVDLRRFLHQRNEDDLII